MIFKLDRPGLVGNQNRPFGFRDLEAGQNCNGRPLPDELGVQSRLQQINLEPDRSALDAFLALFLLSAKSDSKFHSDCWKTLGLSTFTWDDSTTFALRTVARRFAFVSWQFCETCQHYKMAGPRTLRSPATGSTGALPGLHEHLAVNDSCTSCRADLQYRLAGPPYPPATICPGFAWQPLP
jgi:hypothetical protein